MTFVQWEFLAFLSVVFTTYWAIPSRRLQNLFLIVASAVFYGWVHPWFLVLLYASALIDYVGALAMERYPLRRGRVLAVSLASNLAILGYYKYFDFFLTNVSGILSAFGVENSVLPLGILLPAGISFYTFQSMAYSIDVYRGELRARRTPLDYLLAVSLFPHLVAGPVQRASNLLLQAETHRRFDLGRVQSGFSLAMWGLFKKVVVADTVSPYVDKIFGLREPAGPMIWAATLGFAIQILADFSGYTDMARGVARMLGFSLMENFKNPYLAVNPSDFWRRWHVSFSSWIRDYLFIPLGGSRGGFWGTTRATFGAMLISGLWHGASWNFVLWGGYHALLITGYRLVTPRIPAGLRRGPLAHAGAVVLMFGFTCFGWLLFRETDGSALLGHLTRSPLAASADQWVATVTMLAIAGAAAVPLVLGLLVQRWLWPRIEEAPWALPLQTSAWALAAAATFFFGRMSAMDFIYFQF